jgi:hypothetical protein
MYSQENVGVEVHTAIICLVDYHCMYSIENEQLFQINILPSFLALKNKPGKEKLRSR